MELIYTDPKGKELGYAMGADIDFEVGSDETNSHVLDGTARLNLKAWCMFRTQNMAESCVKFRPAQKQIVLPQKDLHGED